MTCNDEEDSDDKDAARQAIITSAIDGKRMRRLMNRNTSSQMWCRLCTVHEQNATENVQLLQQQFSEMRMEPESNVVDHISGIEQLADQLNILGEVVSGQAAMCKILSALPSRFGHMQLAWDIVPRHGQTVESLTLRLLKGENRNRIRGLLDEDEEKAFFSESGQGSGGAR
jgi:hypothetical protein